MTKADKMSLIMITIKSFDLKDFNLTFFSLDKRFRENKGLKEKKRKSVRCCHDDGMIL